MDGLERVVGTEAESDSLALRNLPIIGAESETDAKQLDLGRLDLELVMDSLICGLSPVNRWWAGRRYVDVLLGLDIVEHLVAQHFARTLDEALLLGLLLMRGGYLGRVSKQGSLKRLIEREARFSASDAMYRFHLDGEKRPFVLRVHVDGARSLPTSVARLFCKFEINRDEFERTEVLDGNAGTVTWNADFLFAVNKNDVARISVWKLRRLGSTEMLGHFVLPINLLFRDDEDADNAAWYDQHRTTASEGGLLASFNPGHLRTAERSATDHIGSVQFDRNRWYPLTPSRNASVNNASNSGEIFMSFMVLNRAYLISKSTAPTPRVHTGKPICGTALPRTLSSQHMHLVDARRNRGVVKAINGRHAVEASGAHIDAKELLRQHNSRRSNPLAKSYYATNRVFKNVGRRLHEGAESVGLDGVVGFDGTRIVLSGFNAGNQRKRLAEVGVDLGRRNIMRGEDTNRTLSYTAAPEVVAELLRQPRYREILVSPEHEHMIDAVSELACDALTSTLLTRGKQILSTGVASGLGIISSISGANIHSNTFDRAANAEEVRDATVESEESSKRKFHGLPTPLRHILGSMVHFEERQRFTFDVDGLAHCIDATIVCSIFNTSREQVVLEEVATVRYRILPWARSRGSSSPRTCGNTGGGSHAASAELRSPDEVRSRERSRSLLDSTECLLHVTTDAEENGVIDAALRPIFRGQAGVYDRQ